MTPRVLFILKRQTFGSGEYTRAKTSGLFHSVAFVKHALRERGYNAHEVVVTDNNDIDREVTAYRPTHVILEALWVVPEKFAVLRALHPGVRWAVRIHSEIPFLALEGTALDWIRAYLFDGVAVTCNSARMAADLRRLFPARTPLHLLPNFYPLGKPHRRAPRHYSLEVGCFGAIRPLKNTLTQAVAAIEFAREAERNLRFHVNATRIEGGADPVLRNLRALFAGRTQEELVEHPWLPHALFCDVLGGLDMSMQVSFSETFNLVTADAVSAGVPVVVSPEIRWVPRLFQADPTSIDSIVAAMGRAWMLRGLGGPLLARRGLAAYNRASMRAWNSYLRENP